MAGLLKGLLKVATFGYLGGDSKPKDVECTDPVPEYNPQPSHPTPASTPISNQPFDPSIFWESGDIDNLSFADLDEDEKDALADIIDYINDIYNKDYAPEEAVHITFNPTLDIFEFCVKDGFKKFTVCQDRGIWDAYDEETFFQTFGDGVETEDVYIPPQ